jgi:dTDP-4-dehydrorhamnose reductase
MLTDKKLTSCSRLELWGGIECTINRIGNVYLDQLEFSGHYRRTDDIDVIAELGIKALRYPVLWEHHQPAEDATINWEKTAQQLDKLRTNHLTPIAGLVHHGSGPAYTDLLDHLFPDKLAA